MNNGGEWIRFGKEWVYFPPVKPKSKVVKPTIQINKLINKNKKQS